MTARSFLGAGDLYISRYENGAWSDYEGPFEADKFEIKPNTELKEAISKSRDGYGQVIESVALAKPTDFSATLTSVDRTTLATALMGVSAAVSVAASTVTDEVVTITSLDKWVPLAKMKATNVVVKNSAGSVTYVLGTDYLYDSTLGWIKPLSTGAIVAGTIKVSYAAGALNGSKIRGSVVSEIRARFKLNGVNMADRSPCIVTVHEAVISAASAMDFLSSDFAKVEMPGRLKTPTGKTEPFEVVLLDA